MRLVVEAWDPDYDRATPGDGPDGATSPVEAGPEVHPARWAPLPTASADPAPVLFVDGVRRVDAGVWVGGDDGVLAPGLCASYAAGAVRCDGRAEIVAWEVRRGLFSPAAEVADVDAGRARWTAHRVDDPDPDRLPIALQDAMGALEVEITRTVAGDDLVVVDGPLGERHDLPGALGFVKTHRIDYLPEPLRPVLDTLAAGERTPVFRIATERRPRWSWYLALPGERTHRWSTIVRLECPDTVPVDQAIGLADRSGTLCRFASRPHKDARAPQNLYPVAGLERRLRHLLGDAPFLLRLLRAAAA